MKRVLSGIVLALVGGSVHAEVATPREFYNDKIAGMWASRSGDVNLVYSVRPDSIRIEGESCNATAQGPQNCITIDQHYLVNETQLLRDDQKFGVRAVDLRISDNKSQRRELSPVARDRVSITTEEISPDGHTLTYTVDVQDNGRSIYHHSFQLDRVNAPSASAYATF